MTNPELTVNDGCPATEWESLAGALTPVQPKHLHLRKLTPQPFKKKYILAINVWTHSYPNISHIIIEK